MTLLAILIGWCLLVAAHQARQDAQTIAVNVPIFHVAGWVTRAVLCGGTAFALALAEGNFAVTFPLLCGVAYGSFTPAFRWMLNRRRGLDWRYCSPSSWYDRVFIRWAYRDWPSALGWAMDNHHRIYCSSETAIEFRPGYAMLVSSYRECVHRAGSLAYMVEGAVLAASVLIYWLLPSLLLTEVFPRP